MLKFRYLNLHIILAFASIACLLLSYFFSINTYYSDDNRLLSIIFMLGFAFFFRPAVLKKHPMIGYFGFFVFLFIGQRFVVGSFFTAHNWEHDIYEPHMVTDTMIKISIYIMVFYAILALLKKQIDGISKSVVRAANTINDVFLKFKITIVIYLITSVMYFFITYFGGTHGHNTGQHSTFLFRYIFSALKPDFLFYLALSMFLLCKHIKTRYFKIMMFVSVYFVLIKVVQGSKSAIFELLLVVLLYFSFFNMRQMIKINIKMLMVSCTMIISGVAIFLLMDEIRAIVWYNAGEYFVDHTEEMQSVEKMLYSIDLVSRRLTIFDDAIRVTYWREFGFLDISHLVNPETAWKMSLDALIPSSLYPDLLKAQYALALMIGNDPIIMNGVEIYSGYWWGFYAYHLFTFGFYPGLLVMSLFIILNIYYIKVILYFSPSTFKLAFAFSFISSFFFHYIGLFGYEHVSGMYVYNLILYVFNYALVYVSCKFIRSVRSVKKVKAECLC